MFRECNIKKHNETQLGIIYVVRTQNFPKNQHFVTPRYAYIAELSDGKKS